MCECRDQLLINGLKCADVCVVSSPCDPMMFHWWSRCSGGSMLSACAMDRPVTKYRVHRASKAPSVVKVCCGIKLCSGLFWNSANVPSISRNSRTGSMARIVMDTFVVQFVQNCFTNPWIISMIMCIRLRMIVIVWCNIYNSIPYDICLKAPKYIHFTCTALHWNILKAFKESQTCRKLIIKILMKINILIHCFTV